jgi:hypothetical protein
VKHAIDIVPFTVPNFVRVKQAPRPRQEGVQFAPPIPLSELSVETLDALCAEFRREVFAKAGRVMP